MDKGKFLALASAYRERLLKHDRTVLPLLAECYAFAESVDDATCQSEMLTLKAYEALYLHANYESAISFASEALLYVQPQSFSFSAELHMFLGRANINLSNYHEARLQLYKAIELAEQIESNSGGAFRIQSEVYHLLAMINSMLSLPAERTREYLQKGLHYATLAQSRILIGVCTLGLGNSYIDEQKFDEAIKCYQKALQFVADNEYHNLASVYSNLGYCFVALEQFDEAKDYLNKSLVLREKYCTKDDIAISYLLLSNIYRARKDSTRAEDSLIKAYSFFKETGNKHHLLVAIEYLIKLYKSENDSARTIAYYEEYVALQKQVHELINENQLAEVEAKFRTEQKEKEAVLLRQKSAEIEEYARQLELSNSELRQFAHVASHDLKEPLRMISSYIGLLQRKVKDKLSEEEQQFLTFAVEGSHRMEVLINDLLALSKVNALSKSEQVDLNLVLSDVMKNFQVDIDEGKVQITHAPLPTIMADRIYMVQLFQNLISNGLKYNNSEVKKVSVTLNELPSVIQIVVTDNGIGIEDKYNAQIFDLFKRLHTRKEYSGSGIGLSICKKIVEQLKGTIGVESQPGIGTSFLINLPAQLCIDT